MLRNSVRVELRELHERAGLTTVMVTHDQAEALTLADRVAVMSEGRVQQYGTAEEIYEDPRTAFVASFVGSPPANLVTVTQTETGRAVGTIPWTPPPAVAAALSQLQRREARLALRPAALKLVAPETPHAMRGTIRTVEYMGSDRLVHVDVGGQVIQVRLTGSVADLGPDVGIEIEDTPPVIFSTESGERLNYGNGNN